MFRKFIKSHLRKSRPLGLCADCPCHEIKPCCLKSLISSISLLNLCFSDILLVTSVIHILTALGKMVHDCWTSTLYSSMKISQYCMKQLNYFYKGSFPSVEYKLVFIHFQDWPRHILASSLVNKWNFDTLSKPMCLRNVFPIHLLLHLLNKYLSCQDLPAENWSVFLLRVKSKLFNLIFWGHHHLTSALPSVPLSVCPQVWGSLQTTEPYHSAAFVFPYHCGFLDHSCS